MKSWLANLVKLAPGETKGDLVVSTIVGILVIFMVIGLVAFFIVNPQLLPLLLIVIPGYIVGRLLWKSA